MVAICTHTTRCHYSLKTGSKTQPNKCESSFGSPDVLIDSWINQSLEPWCAAGTDEDVDLDLNQKFNKSVVFLFYGSDSGVISQLCNLVRI